MLRPLQPPRYGAELAPKPVDTPILRGQASAGSGPSAHSHGMAGRPHIIPKFQVVGTQMSHLSRLTF